MATFAEFFAGIGLVRDALEPLGWRCVFANDIAPAKAQMYRDRFGADHMVVADVKQLGVGDLPARMDLVTASFPCIDLSLAGNRAGLAGEHSGAIWPFLDLLQSHCRTALAKPAAVLLENVTGFLSSRGGRDLAAVCGYLARLGYAMDLAVVDARWFTPQSRPRLFVMAVNADDATRCGPPSAKPSRLRPRRVRGFQAAHPHLPFADLPLDDPPARAPLSLANVVEDVAATDHRWWPGHQTAALLRDMAPRHRERVLELLAGERDGVATLYRRCRHGRTVGEVRADDIAGCLRTPQGGSSVQFLVDGRSGEARVRPLTGREYARLQGADDFPIRVNDRQARLGFGDGVCVPAVRWLAERAFAHIVARRPIASRQPSLFSSPPAAPASKRSARGFSVHRRGRGQQRFRKTVRANWVRGNGTLLLRVEDGEAAFEWQGST